MKAMQKQFKVNSHEFETITEDLILNVDDIQVLHGDYVVDDESDVKVAIRQIDHLDQITDNSIHSSTINCENSDFTVNHFYVTLRNRLTANFVKNLANTAPVWSINDQSLNQIRIYHLYTFRYLTREGRQLCQADFFSNMAHSKDNFLK